MKIAIIIDARPYGRNRWLFIYPKDHHLRIRMDEYVDINSFQGRVLEVCEVAMKMVVDKVGP